MADEIRVNRPQPQMVQESSAGMMPSNRGSKLPWIILGVVVVVLLVVGFMFRDKLMGKGGEMAEGKNSGYQAVFLTNGQVYFGKLSGINGKYATLTDIYYLQVTTPPGLQGSAQQTAAQQQQQQQAKLELVKLGKELHGPVDSMKINRDQILFFEDMTEDGQVMQAIRTNQKNPQGAATQQNQTPATQQAPATQQQTTPVK